jgi:hypothetical protein
VRNGRELDCLEALVLHENRNGLAVFVDDGGNLIAGNELEYHAPPGGDREVVVNPPCPWLADREPHVGALEVQDLDEYRYRLVL